MPKRSHYTSPNGKLLTESARPQLRGPGRSDAALRAILARLEREESVSVSDLARPFAFKLPAAMKHLDVLDEAGLIVRSKKRRTATVHLRPDPISEAIEWLRCYERFWSRRPGSTRDLHGKQRNRSEEKKAMASLTLVRQIKARPSIVFEALTTPEGIAAWWGPDAGPVLFAETDARLRPVQGAVPHARSN
jgi:DNA-binding transcriptional ArsR family regulator